MLKTRILELVDSIPPASKIYMDAKPGIPGATALTAADQMVHRQAHALLDPSFPWHYAQAFAQLRQPLPALVHEPFIKQAHTHLLHNASNDDIAGAQVIQHPRWTTKRGFLEALLLLPNLRLDEVAQHTGLPVAVVLAYEQLFWNVRDRLNDPLLMNELCYPETRQVEYQADYWNNAEPRDLMLRAAFKNDLDTVLQIFGTRTSREEQPSETSAKKVKTSIMAEADFVIRAGGCCSKVPVLDAARRMIAATEKHAVGRQANGDDVIGLTAVGLTPGESILQTLSGLTDKSNFNRLAALQTAGEPEKN